MQLTFEQFAEYCGCSVEALLKNTKRFVDRVEKEEKFVIKKKGRGKAAIFFLEPSITEEETHKNIKSLFEIDKRELQMNKQLLNLEQLQFAILVLLLSNTHQTYRGSLGEWEAEVCQILGMPKKTQNYMKLLESVRAMELNELIWVHVEGQRLSVMLRDKALFDTLLFDTDMVACSKDIAAELSVRSWVSVLKVWLACRVISLDGQYTQAMNKVCEMTGLSPKTVSKIVKGLNAKEAFRIKPLFNRDANGNIINRYGTFIEECGWLSK